MKPLSDSDKFTNKYSNGRKVIAQGSSQIEKGKISKNSSIFMFYTPTRGVNTDLMEEAP